MGSACGPPYAVPSPIWSPGNRAFGLRLESACALNSPGRRVVRGCEASGSNELRRRFSLRHHFMPMNAIRQDPSGTAATGAAFVAGYLARPDCAGDVIRMPLCARSSSSRREVVTMLSAGCTWPGAHGPRAEMAASGQDGVDMPGVGGRIHRGCGPVELAQGHQLRRLGGGGYRTEGCSRAQASAGAEGTSSLSRVRRPTGRATPAGGRGAW